VTSKEKRGNPVQTTCGRSKKWMGKKNLQKSGGVKETKQEKAQTGRSMGPRKEGKGAILLPGGGGRGVADRRRNLKSRKQGSPRLSGTRTASVESRQNQRKRKIWGEATNGGGGELGKKKRMVHIAYMEGPQIHVKGFGPLGRDNVAGRGTREQGK